MQVFKLKVVGTTQSASQNALKGHVISIAHSGPHIVTQLPRRDVLGHISALLISDRSRSSQCSAVSSDHLDLVVIVILMGAQVERNARGTIFQARSAVVFLWLRVLRAVNPHYVDIDLDESHDCASWLDSLSSAVHVEVSENDEVREIEERTTSDVARVRTELEDELAGHGTSTDDSGHLSTPYPEPSHELEDIVPVLLTEPDSLVNPNYRVDTLRHLREHLSGEASQESTQHTESPPGMVTQPSPNPIPETPHQTPSTPEVHQVDSTPQQRKMIVYPR